MSSIRIIWRYTGTLLDRKQRVRRVSAEHGNDTRCMSDRVGSVVVRRQPVLAVDEVDGEVLGRVVLREPPRPWHAIGSVSARSSAVELREHHLAATRITNDGVTLRSFYLALRYCIVAWN